jgi:hypothetical protein
LILEVEERHAKVISLTLLEKEVKAAYLSRYGVQFIVYNVVHSPSVSVVNSDKQKSKPCPQGREEIIPMPSSPSKF